MSDLANRSVHIFAQGTRLALDRLCPFQQGEVNCGDWCPMFSISKHNVPELLNYFLACRSVAGTAIVTTASAAKV